MKRIRALVSFVACVGLLVPTAASAAASGYYEVEKEGTGQVTVGFGTQGTFLLNTFDLGFTNGDHEVRKIALTTTSNGVNAAFTDNNADDPIRFRGRYMGYQSVRTHTATATCQGACTIPVAARPTGTGWGLALRGFKLERSSGDSNVRKVEIRPTADRKSYRVEYRDNGTFSYKVTLQYAWVSTGRAIQTSASGTRSASQRNAVIPLSATTKSTASVLQGFSFEFLNGDHHLRDIAVLQDKTNKQYSVRFNDNNYDDPVRASIDVLFLI